MRRRTARVFVGVWEISNMVFSIADALRSGGYEVETLVVDTPFEGYYSENEHDHHVRWPSGDRIYRAPVDRSRFNLEMARHLWALARRCDTFVFVWRYSFLPFQLDIPLLRMLGKRVVIFFCGDDVRYKPIQVELDRKLLDKPWWPATDSPAFARWMGWGRGFFEALWTVKLAEKTGCHIVGTRDSATFQGRTYSGFMMPQRMLVDEPRAASDEPLIIHAPTNPDIKGTRQVEEAVEQLRAEGLRFRFELVQGLPANELDDVLRECEIVIDQPGVWPGRLGVTAMAAGAVVVGGNQAGYWHVPDPSPVQQFERDATLLAGVLRQLITDRPRRQELMRQSLEYARRNYSYEAFVDYFEGLLEDRQPYPLEPLPEQKQLVRSLAPGPLHKLAISLFW
jgi:hypothetical protein